MKKWMIVAAVLVLVAALAVFFWMQATPRHILSSVRADALEVSGGVLTIPEKYRVIDDGVFAGKIDFHTLVLPDGIAVGVQSFYGCTNLKFVYCEGSVTLGAEAFGSNGALTRFVVNGSEGSCDDTAFHAHGALRILCPAASPIAELAKRQDISYQTIEHAITFDEAKAQN